MRLIKEITRDLLLAEEISDSINRGLNKNLQDSITPILGEIRETKKLQVKMVDALEYLKERTLSRENPPYHSGIVTIGSLTAVGVYPKLENLITTLGYPAFEGTIFNFGPGNLFFVFSKDGVTLSSNETRLNTSMGYNWAAEDRYPVRYIHIRSDTDNLVYQIVAG